ncbi:MAG TPA: ribokinase, partial [Candidatus Merdenecus merdavium]|nr:ribokinase [Candidatus Merdenecus merdavium]
MKLAVVGSINLDMTVTAERIPQKGETLTGSNISYIPGGKGANQAVAMAR